MKEWQLANYKLFQKVFRPIFDTLIDTSIQNPQNVPDEGPFVLVSNHRSDLDPFLIIVNVRRPINFLGASYLLNIPIAKHVVRGLGMIPVSKYRSEIRDAFDTAADCLTAGEGVGIFPEGWDYIAENQFDWSVGRFQTGFARIAIETGAPVVPVALQGLSEKKGRQTFPPFVRKMLDYPIEMQYIKDRCEYRKLHINVGRPIPVPEGADPNDHEAVKALTRKANEEVARLYEELPAVAGFEDIERRPASMDVPPLVPAKIPEEEAEDGRLE